MCVCVYIYIYIYTTIDRAILRNKNRQTKKDGRFIPSKYIHAYVCVSTYMQHYLPVVLPLIMHTHTHTSICVCVCVCVYHQRLCDSQKQRRKGGSSRVSTYMHMFVCLHTCTRTFMYIFMLYVCVCLMYIVCMYMFNVYMYACMFACMQRALFSCKSFLF
jgi:hypothetical protein